MDNVPVEQSWVPARGQVHLGAGELHLWRADVAALCGLSGTLSAWFSVDEIRRSRRFLDEGARCQFLSGRLLLRKVLSLYSGSHPFALQFAIDNYGKPGLILPALTDLEFNLSHSDGVVLAAFSRNIPLGIDVEYTPRAIDFDLIARKNFSTLEQQMIRSLPDVEQRVAFYNCWTRKEALLKGLGMGIRVPLQKFSVAVQGSGWIKIIECQQPEFQECKDWQLYGIEYAKDFTAALAVKTCAPLRLYQWSASPEWIKSGNTAL